MRILRIADAPHALIWIKPRWQRYLLPIRYQTCFHCTSTTGFPDTGLALRQTCQSGVWRSSAPYHGVYSYVGNFKGAYNGRNTSGKQYRIFVSGGNPPSQKINFGNSDNCINTFSLVASVDGYTVANSVDGNSQWNKSGSISFDVPDGSAFSVISNGMMAYGCDFGSFTLLRYQ